MQLKDSKAQKVLIAGIMAAGAIPAIVHAQASSLNDLFEVFHGIITTLLPMLLGLAVLLFLWGVAKYILHGDNEDARKEGRMFIVNGIIAIFVIVSVWGLVNMLDRFFGLDDTVGSSPVLPAIPPPPTS